MIRRLKENEDGSILVTALAFVAAMGLVMGALAELAQVNFRNTSGTRDQREVVYTADAAVKSAISEFRATQTCANTPNVNGVTSVSVSCSDTTTTSTGGAATNQPPLAIITLPAAGESGIVADSGGTTFVQGGLYSKTNLQVSGSQILEVEGPVTARTGCNIGGSAQLISDSTVTKCSIGSGSDPNAPDGIALDPAYAAAVTSPPAEIPVPACPASGPVTMLPGTYKDAAALNALFGGPCADRVFHFRPAADGSVGVYYFEFTNSGSRIWTLNNSSMAVIGGTLPAGQTLSTIATPTPVGLPAGQRCNKQASGVQFVFGGDSQWDIQAGSVDLCAQYDSTATQQQIAVLGLNMNYDSADPVALSPVTPSTASDTGFVPFNAARAIDTAVATAEVATNATATKSVTLGGFNVSGIPAGSTINRVRLQWTNRSEKVDGPGNASNLSKLELSATATNTATSSSVTCTSGASCLTKLTSPATDTWDVTSTFPTIAALQSLSLEYKATAEKNGSNDTSYKAHLDGVRLLVDYILPGFHRQAGCVATAPYPTAGCAFLRTAGSQSNLSIHGTVYAPLAAVDVELTNVASQVFGRGLIARSLWAKVTSSSACAPPACSPFQLPSPTTVPSLTTVVFQATVEGNRRLRALVEFPAGGGTPVVKSWATTNEQTV